MRWGATRSMSQRRRVFITRVLYNKHFHDNNLVKFNNAEVSTTCKLCGSARDGQQHILRKCREHHPAMMRRRRRQETSLYRKVCTAETQRDPMAIFFRGYYNTMMAVERRPDAHEFWIGVFSEPALLDLEGMELVIVDIPTDRQFNALRFCGKYAQAAKAMFMEGAIRMGEAAEARGEKACKSGCVQGEAS